MSILLLVLALIFIVILVAVHEFGHFVVARRNGVIAEEYGLGFPPRIWSKKMKGGWLFSVNWLPLGGFVKMKGEHDADTEKGSYGAASVWSKTKIIIAGITMNVITAYILFTILALIGMPQLVNNQFTIASNTKVIKSEVLVVYVEPNSPAAKAGIKDQDQLLSISDSTKSHKITSANNLPGITEGYAGQEATITYKRNGKVVTSTATLRTTKEENSLIKSGQEAGYLGIEPTNYVLQRSTWSAPIVAAGLMKQITVLTFKGLYTAISALFHGNTSKASAQVTGPVGIFEILKNGSLLGYQFVLSIVALISLSLAIFNLLPIPVLDGGKLFMMYLARLIKRKAFSPKTEEWVTGISVVFVIILFVLITIVDVRR